MTYRAAIVGAGAPIAHTNANLEGFSIGYAHAGGYLAHPDVEVVAVADIRPENAGALAAHVGGAAVYTDLAEMLQNEQIDILSICTWPTLHMRMTLAAIDAGVRMILCEKPMGVSVAEIDTMRERAESAGARLFVNHQRRFQQPYSGAKRFIADGHLGDVLRVEGWVGDGWDVMSWGSHWVDMSRFLVGSEVSWVFAAASATGRVRYGHLVEDRMLLQLGFESGATGLIDTSPRRVDPGLIVVGTKATLVFDGSSVTVMTADADSRELSAAYFEDAASEADPFASAVADLISATATGAPSLIDGASGHADMAVILAAFESAARFEVVELAGMDRAGTREASASS